MIELAQAIACCAGSFVVGLIAGGLLVYREMRRFNRTLQRDAQVLEAERDALLDQRSKQRVLRAVPRGPYA